MRINMLQELEKMMTVVHNKLKNQFFETMGGEPVTRIEFESKLKLKAGVDDFMTLKDK